MNIVVPICPGRDKIASQVIQALSRFYPEMALCVITDKKTFQNIRQKSQVQLRFFDEDADLEGFTLARIKDLLPENVHCRAGWYFQQLIKWHMAKIFHYKDYYVVWDADTIPLKRIELFVSERPVFILKEEYHKPYFDLILELFRLEKKDKHSYIAEFMVLSTAIVREIMATCQARDESREWFENILLAMTPSAAWAGFSEYETYGTWVDHYHPGRYRKMTLKTLRINNLYGKRLNFFDLSYLRTQYDIVTLEQWSPVGWKEIFLTKLKSCLFVLGLYPFLRRFFHKGA